MVHKRRRRYFSIALLILVPLAIQLWNIWLHKKISGGDNDTRRHGSSYCTHPNYKCYERGWPSCCHEPPSYWNIDPCPEIRPVCDDDIADAAVDMLPQSNVRVILMRTTKTYIRRCTIKHHHKRHYHITCPAYY